MNRFRERELLPAVLLFYMMMSLVHLHAFHAPSMRVAVSGDRLLAGLEWHMMRIADQERNGAFSFFPGN